MSDLTQNNWNRFQQARGDREKYPVQEKDMQPEVRQYALEGQMDDEERKRERCSLFLTRLTNTFSSPAFGTGTTELKEPNQTQNA